MDDKRSLSRIAFVCQRYGEEINGGAELLCRQVAERMAAHYDVTVYTTCATDYVTWANVYPEGEDILNGVRVLRFPVIRKRRPRRFSLLSQIVLRGQIRPSKLEEKWIDAQGPLCPALVCALERDNTDYKAVLFMTYLYYTTVRGLCAGMDHALLIPTVHDEPPVYLHCFDRVFSRAAGFVWNSPEERAFARKRFPQITGKPEVVTGAGIELPASLPPLPEALRETEYILYSGRIDGNKGCGQMFRYFLRYKQEHRNGLKLVLTGKEVYPIPKDPDIIHLGFVEESVKFSVMSGALALVLFSPFESLSLVVLESMAAGRPVIVTEKSEVLRGHCERSGAGISFSDYESFAAAVDRMRTAKEEYARMRENGKKYVEENYRWERILESYRTLIDTIGRNSSLRSE